jgi:hypothetical protein
MSIHMDMLHGFFLKLKAVERGELLFIYLIYQNLFIFIKSDGKSQYFQ